MIRKEKRRYRQVMFFQKMCIRDSSMIVIVLVVGLLCYDRAGKQAQNMAGAVLVMEE